jgi:hypothetical protein
VPALIILCLVIRSALRRRAIERDVLQIDGFNPTVEWLLIVNAGAPDFTDA